MVGLPEATAGGALWKRLFLKILQYPQETPVLEFLFKKVEGLKACNFIKKMPQHRYIPVNIAKFLRLLISKNIWDRLLFDCFNGSLLHGPKGSSSKLYDGVRLQGPSHRSSSLFLSRHLSYWSESWSVFENLERIPLMSQLSFYIGYFLCCSRWF